MQSTERDRCLGTRYLVEPAGAGKAACVLKLCFGPFLNGAIAAVAFAPLPLEFFLTQKGIVNPNPSTRYLLPLWYPRSTCLQSTVFINQLTPS